MSVAEKIKAVYNYCRQKIRYNGDSDKSDWKGEAYRGLTEFKGDCFTYYSAAYLLLSKIDGVEVMSVERLGGLTHHYWCLVNIGTGWYHFDPLVAGHHKHRCFMWTNKQCQVKPYFWRSVSIRSATLSRLHGSCRSRTMSMVLRAASYFPNWRP